MWTVFPVTEKAVFALAFADAVASMAGSALFFVVHVVRTYSVDSLACLLPFVVGYLSNAMGILLTTEVAFIRLQSVYVP